MVGFWEVRYFLSTSSSSFWSSPPVFFLGGQNLPGLGICHLEPSTPKRLRRGREEVAAAQAVTARVFLAVPDGPVLYRPCAPPYYFLCRVCRALKKAGPPAPSYLIFRVVRSGSRWGGAPFDTSSWAIWAGQRDSTRARSLKPGRRARLWSQGGRSCNRTLSTSLLTFLRRLGHTTPPRASQALLCLRRHQERTLGKKSVLLSFVHLVALTGRWALAPPPSPRPTPDERRPPLLSSPLLDPDLHAAEVPGLLPAQLVCQFHPTGHPSCSRQSTPEREKERGKEKALHSSHQAPVTIPRHTSILPRVRRGNQSQTP